MNLRQKIQIILMILLSLFAFAAYHEGTGSAIWLQFLSVICIMGFLLIFDLGFTDEHSFIFDPDADNWRRKVVRAQLLKATFNGCTWCFGASFWFTGHIVFSFPSFLMSYSTNIVCTGGFIQLVFSLQYPYERNKTSMSQRWFELNSIIFDWNYEFIDGIWYSIFWRENN